MIWEAVSVGLAVATGISAVLAWIYKKGHSAGIDDACGKRIEEKLDNLKKEVGQRVSDSVGEHNNLHSRIDEVHSRVNDCNDSIKDVKTDVAYIKGKIDNFPLK